MKTLPVLLLFFLTSTLWAEPSDKPQSLEEALLSNDWSWECYTTGHKLVQSISFYRGGFAQNLRYFSAHWDITGPNTVVLRNTNKGTRMADKKVVLTFNKEFTHYEGIDFNGRTKVEGSRGRRVDPNRALETMIIRPTGDAASVFVSTNLPGS